jgi:hypothetical protein
MLFEMQMTHKVIIKTEETDFEKLKQSVFLTLTSRNPNVRIIDHKPAYVDINLAEHLIDLTDAMTDEEIEQYLKKLSMEASDDAI